MKVGSLFAGKVALVDGDGRRIYGAGIPDGRYRLVPVKEAADA